MFLDEELMRLHQEQLLKEAENSRLIAQIRKRSPRRASVYGLAFAWLGIRLCRWGTLLQERFEVAETVAASQSMNNGIKT
jgi:hypothetical protein